MAVEITYENFEDYFGNEVVETRNSFGAKRSVVNLYSKLYDEGWIYLPQESEIEGTANVHFYNEIQKEENKRNYAVDEKIMQSSVCYDDDRGDVSKHVDAIVFRPIKGNITFVKKEFVKEYSIDEKGRHIILVNGKEYFDEHSDCTRNGEESVPWCGQNY